MKLLKFWFPLIVYSGIIFAVSSVPNLSAPLSRYNFDKVIHMTEYSILAILWSRALKSAKPGLSGNMIWAVAVVFCFLYGASDEFHQSFVPGRSCDPFDLLADTIGGFIGGWIYNLWAFNYRAKK